MKLTPEEKFWSTGFGDDYIGRNSFTDRKFDESYVKKYGRTRTQMDQEILKGIKKTVRVLEVGSNIGLQLSLLQSLGFRNLFGVEISQNAVEISKQRTKNINIIQGSGFDLPFRDEYFDMVFTSGLLIHINPKDLKRMMNEIHRTSNRYIWGFEYFNPEYTAVPYRNNQNRLWKGDFCQMYLNLFPDLKLVKRKKIKYLDSENRDEMFLLEKKGSHGRNK